MIGHYFIKHPRFSFVITIIIILCGLISLYVLPISMYPKVTPPTVVVSTAYPGANAETVRKSVITPLENAINGVQDMLYMESKSFNDGSASITVTFKVGTDANQASINVQNRVYGAYSSLPNEVRKQGVDVGEQSTDILCVVSVYSPKGTYDTVFLNNYSAINLKNAIARIKGVGSVKVFGNKDYSMRVWMNPDKLASLHMTTSDVVAAISAQNVQVASGQIGAEPAPEDQQFMYVVQTQGRLKTAKEFENIIIRTKSDGSTVRIKDVAKVELGSETYSSTGVLDGKYPASLLIINQRPGANALAVVSGVKKVLKDASKYYPKDFEAKMYYDTTKYTRSAIKEVIKTLIFAVIIVVLIVYVFLQSWRATLIACTCMPACLIGTLGVLYAIGYSINTITLFGLILAIGIVVDDSILEVENDTRLMAEEGLTPVEAANKTVTQITAPVLATTAVLMAVFVPVAFFPGITGEIYRQFSITIVVAVCISTLDSLTLSPALCSSILKRPDPNKKEALFFRMFNKGFNWLKTKYGYTVAYLVRKLAVVVILFLAVTVAMCFFFKETPSGFIPLEDQGRFMVNIQLPSGASLERTKEVASEVGNILNNTKGVDHYVTMNGYNGLTQSYDSNCAFVIVILDDWSKRTTMDLFSFSILKRLRTRFSKMPDADITPFIPPSIPGLGMSDGFEFVIQDTLGGSPVEMGNIMNKLIEEAKKQPEIMNAFSSFRTDVPQLYVNVDRDKVEKMGVNISDVFATLQDYLGSKYVNDFNRFGNVYKVIVQGQKQARSKISDIGKLYVKSKTGKMVPLGTFITINKIVGPNMISRFNMFQSCTVLGMAGQGYSSGQAIKVMEKIAKKLLPPGYKYRWSGMSYQEILAGNKVFLVFAASFIFIYLFLVAQYESWMLVLSVMMAVPVAVFGAMGSLFVLSKFLPLINNNLYAQVGIVLLFGLSTKTAILIVEFAKQNHEEGMPVIEAAKYASSLRFRAVVMTALSFIFGTFPLVIAFGPGAMGMRSIGTVIFGGMIVAIFVGTCLIPGYYVLMQTIINRGKKGNSTIDNIEKPSEKAILNDKTD